MITLLRPNTHLKFTTIVGLTSLGAILLSPFTTVAQTLDLNGAGATFPAPLYERYFAEFKKKNPNITVNYQPIGSGGGIKQFINETVDFGASDAAMSDKELSQVKRGTIMVPTAGGAVAVVFNIAGVKNLKLSRSVFADIFTGKITKWNDSRISDDNKGVSLPDKAIKLAVRADGSGTTFIFTNHLSAIDSNFKSKIGVSKSPNWVANPLKGKGNDGVANLVKQNEGSIGYVEAEFAKRSNLATAAIQNGEGNFVLPTLAEANKALETVKFPENFRVFEGNPGKGYPITGLTWLLVYTQYDSSKVNTIKQLVEWCLTDGQKINSELGYTKIPASVAQSAIKKVNDSLK